jgi:hypothetical protein
MKIFRIAKEEPIEEYLLEGGLLYDEDAEDVFSISELGEYNVPIFKSPREANEFLENLEKHTTRKFGRVPERNFMKEIRYKDTRKEREEEERKYIDQRNEQLKKGIF